jgi:hypothetical protein
MGVPLLGGGQGLPDLGGVSAEELAQGPRGTLVICNDCGTIEYVPAFDGPPEYNQPLIARLTQHREYVAGTEHPHTKALTTVNAFQWETNNDYRAYITKAIIAAQKTGDVGIGKQNYELRNTFEQDAFTCWKQHNKTTDCGDYKSDKKRLVPPTRDDRKELGLETRSKHIYTTAFLCDYCPVKSLVQEKHFKKKGLYD